MKTLWQLSIKKETRELKESIRMIKGQEDKKIDIG